MWRTMQAVVKASLSLLTIGAVAITTFAKAQML
jgi:hypothetical protein